MIGGVVGQLTLLLVLVNGLLIWTAYGVFSTQQTELQTIAARALEFDLEMRHYGPEADQARDLLKRDLDWALEQFWGEDPNNADAYDASYKVMGEINAFFDSLDPKTPAQTESARSGSLELRVHWRATAPDVAAGGDPGRLASDLRRDLLVYPHVRSHGALVEIEPDVGCDPRRWQRVDRARDLSHP